MAVRGGVMVAALAGAVLMVSSGAQAQVRDAVYRGTLVCEKLPFFEAAAREAIEVKIKGSEARYVHVLRVRSELSFEQGTGVLDGDKITLKGEWSGVADSYQASYGGTFVRRSATLTGTQTWQHDGKTTRANARARSSGRSPPSCRATARARRSRSEVT